jgi:hypothetical protein
VPLCSQEGGQNPKPVLYVIGTSHLDSQWNWTIQDTIRQFVPATFFDNFVYRLSPARFPLPGAVVTLGTPRRLDYARKKLSGEPVGEY